VWPVSHLVLFLVILTGALLGMLPYLVFLGSLKFAAVYLGGALLAALTVTARQVSARNEEPRLAEDLCAVLGVGAFAAGAAAIGFALFGLAHGLVELLHWLQWGWQANPASVAFWTSGPFTVLLCLAALSFSPIPRALFPEFAGIGSAFDGLSRGRKLLRDVPLFFGGAALTILTYLFWPDLWWLHLFALSAITNAGKDAMDAARNWSPALVLGREAVQAMQKLYAALGYETVVSPRTKDQNEEVDSLLKKVDLLAIREQDVLMVELKTAAQGNRIVSAADASLLPISARVVSRYLSKDAESPVQVRPVLVLIGLTATADLGRLAEDEAVKVLSLTEGVVREVNRTEDENVWRGLALRYLQSDPPSIAAQSGSIMAGAAAGAAP
jgi:hypothetical protein